MENGNNLCDGDNLVISITLRQEPVHHVVYRLLRRETYKQRVFMRNIICNDNFYTLIYKHLSGDI